MPTRPDSQDILDGTITIDDISASLIDAVPASASLRTLGTGSQQAAAGDDSRFNSVSSDPNPSFLVLSNTSSLNAERLLSGGLGVVLTDFGANSSATLDLQLSGTNVSILTGSDGKTLIISASQAQAQGDDDADIDATYVVMSLTSSLPNERVLSGGLGVVLTDFGANGPATLDLQLLTQDIIFLTTGSDGKTLVLSASAADRDASYVVMGLTASLPNERVLSGGLGVALNDFGANGPATLDLQIQGQDIIFVTTGSDSKTLILSASAADREAGYIVTSLTASLPNERVLSGGLGVSLNDFGANNPLTLDLQLLTQDIIFLTTGSDGKTLVLSASAADRDASYVVMGLTASLPNERVLSGGLGINLTDGGANSSAIVDLSIGATGTMDIVTGSGDVIVLSGSGMTEDRHKQLRQLQHFIDDGPAEGFLTGAYKEFDSQPFPTTASWYTDSSKTTLVVEKTIERTASPATIVAPTPIIWRMYDEDGSTVLATIQDDITYDGVFEINRTRTITQ